MVVTDVAERAEVLRRIAIAADPIKFRLLSHAAAFGSFRSSEAAALAGEDPKSGTVRTVHTAALTRAGLLIRHDHPRVMYEITPAGRAAHAAILAALNSSGIAHDADDQVAVLVVLDRTVYEEIQQGDGDAAELELVLRHGIRQARGQERVFRVTRVD